MNNKAIHLNGVPTTVVSPAVQQVHTIPSPFLTIPIHQRYDCACAKPWMCATARNTPPPVCHEADPFWGNAREIWIPSELHLQKIKNKNIRILFPRIFRTRSLLLFLPYLIFILHYHYYHFSILSFLSVVVSSRSRIMDHDRDRDEHG